MQESQKLEEGHSYHDLRHTFGTNLFYAMCKNKAVRFDDVTPTSSIYLYVAKRMGHSINSRNSNISTKSYIRSAHVAEQLNAI